MALREPHPTGRQLHERGETATVVASRLLDESGSAEWAGPVLTRAASEAARSGDFDHATALLRRALEAMPPVIDVARVRLVIELGRVEAASGLADANRRWETAADQLAELDLADRIDALVDLGEATYSSGLLRVARQHFERAYELAGRWDERNVVDDETMARIVAGLSTASLLTGHRHRGVESRLRSVVQRMPPYPDLPTRALMASAAGEVALGIDMPADLVHRLIDGALGDRPLPSAVLRPVFEPLSAALSLTGRPDHAIRLLDAQLDHARSQNDIVAHISLLPLRAHAHLLSDQLGEARSDATDAIELVAANPSASRLAEAPARYALSVALLELDEVTEAESICDVVDHQLRWGGTPMHGWFLDGLARVHAAARRHDEAIRTWNEAARAFTLVGGSGVICEWRDGLARSLLAAGDLAAAQRVADDQLTAAASFGDRRISAIAQATAAAIDDDHRRAADRLTVALAELPRPSSEMTRCRLGFERGSRLRRAGLRRAARDQLTASLAIASRLDARRLVRSIRDELAAAGAEVDRDARSTHAHELTDAERLTAELAAGGLSNVEIAQHRSVSRKTIESQLSSVYRKLGVHGRNELDQALEPTSGPV